MAANEIEKLLKLMADTVNQTNVEPATQTALLANLFQIYGEKLKRLCTTLKEEEVMALQEMDLRFQALAKPGAFNTKDAGYLRYLCSSFCGQLCGGGGGKAASGGAGGGGPERQKAGGAQGQKKGKPKSNASAGAVVDANTKLPAAASAGLAPDSGPALSTPLSASSILSSSSSTSSRSRPAWKLVTTDCSYMCFEDSVLYYMSDVDMTQRDRILSDTYKVLRSATTVIKFMDKSCADKRYSAETVRPNDRKRSAKAASFPFLTHYTHAHAHRPEASSLARFRP